MLWQRLKDGRLHASTILSPQSAARLRAETRVLFWLIIAMNTVVVITFILAYQYF
jgi:hypothetical protein